MMTDTDSFSQRIIGIALLSASALFLEVILTRLFSALYFPPYVFFIISFAILGIGIGAAICAIFPSFTNEPRLVLYTSGASLSSLILAVISVMGASQNIQVILFALLLIPYLFVGLSLSALFSQYSKSSRVLYMSDLLGAGIGAILVIPLLNMFGAVNGILVAALGFAISAIYFYSQRYIMVIVISIVASVAVFGSNVALEWLEVDMASLVTDKPITDVLRAGGHILQTEWDAFARTDLVEPAGGGLLRIYVDGGAASIMPADAANNQELTQDIGFFPFATDQPATVFVVGPGAGLDVWFGLQSNAEKIVAVEVNPASVAMVEQWAGINGRLYAQSIVDVIIDDARSVLRRSDERYDLIYLSQVVTLAAERGGYALSENTIYTVEAFDEYLAHLSENGQIALKLYDEITLTRAVSTALASLRKRGLTDQEAMKHLLILLDARASAPIPLLLVRNTPFTEDDSLVLGAIARDVGFTPMYLPHAVVQSPLDTVDDGSVTFDTLVQNSSTDISAPTDNRPYFFQFERGIPQTLQPLTLIITIIALGGILFYGLVFINSSDAITRYSPPYFAMLGIGFITIEIFAIQQTRLFLGHPTFAVTLVLVTFLVGGGIGSGLSQRFFGRLLEKSSYWIPVIIVALFIIWNQIWHVFSLQFVASDLIVRGIFATVTLIPLALMMGIPFPLGLRLVGESDKRLVAVAWSVNGVATVIGTVITVVLSIIAGFEIVAIMGCIAYSIAAGMLFSLRTRGSS